MRKTERIGVIGCLIGLVWMPIYGQKPEEILDRMAKAYKQARSIQIETINRTNVYIKSGQQERRGQGEYMMSSLVERPNKLRIEVIQNGKQMPGVGRLFCNGRQLYIENPNLKQTLRRLAPDDLKQIYTLENLRYAECTSAGFDPVMLMALGDWRSLVESPRLIGRERIEGRYCYRIRAKVKNDYMLNPAFERPIYEDVWIGVKDYLIWRVEISMRVKLKEGEQIMTVIGTVSKQIVNKPIPASRFEYRLPAGFRFSLSPEQRIPLGRGMVIASSFARSRSR
jgi:outer membrane lipoprotein-sorting protein